MVGSGAMGEPYSRSPMPVLMAQLRDGGRTVHDAEQPEHQPEAAAREPSRRAAARPQAAVAAVADGRASARTTAAAKAAMAENRAVGGRVAAAVHDADD